MPKVGEITPVGCNICTDLTEVNGKFFPEKKVDHCSDLLLGDCLDVMRSLPSQSFNAIITDPPYGIDYQSTRRNDKEERIDRIANDKQPFVWWLLDAFRLLKDGGHLLCFCRWDVQEAFRLAIGWAGFKIRGHLIWDRIGHGMADLQTCFAPQHDIIWHAAKGRALVGSPRPTSIFRHGRLSGQELTHPNEKPINLLRELVRSVTSYGDNVLDPFMGSGSCGVACAVEGRKFTGIELDEGYFLSSSRIIRSTESKMVSDRLRQEKSVNGTKVKLK